MYDRYRNNTGLLLDLVLPCHSSLASENLGLLHVTKTLLLALVYATHSTSSRVGFPGAAGSSLKASSLKASSLKAKASSSSMMAVQMQPTISVFLRVFAVLSLGTTVIDKGHRRGRITHYRRDSTIMQAPPRLRNNLRQFNLSNSEDLICRWPR